MVEPIRIEADSLTKEAMVSAFAKIEMLDADVYSIVVSPSMLSRFRKMPMDFFKPEERPGKEGTVGEMLGTKILLNKRMDDDVVLFMPKHVPHSEVPAVVLTIKPEVSNIDLALQEAAAIKEDLGKLDGRVARLTDLLGEIKR